MTKANQERARAREEQERRQAADERLRIARELHDVLGHHLSLINVQAGVGLHLMDNRPEQAREALAAIKTASSEALREVRAVLGVLRPEEEAAPRQPALGLDRLTDLTADAGLPVTTRTVGERRDLPAEVDRAAYRIVQEALTNVRRHAAAGAAATVSVEYTPDELRLEVRNDGPGEGQHPDADPAPAGDPEGDGSGIAGMRARAASLGGSLDAGPLPDGGYRVAAVLPTIPASA
jgi:signal transduction histidine kinase